MLEEGGAGIVGEVGVDVYANVDRLETDLNKARRSSQAFERDVNRGMKKAAGSTKSAEDSVKSLDKATEELARAYSPVHAAQMRYVRDLEKIQRLEKAGVFNSKDARLFSDKAKDALRDAEIANSRAGKLGIAAREQINRWSAVLLAAAGVVAVAVVRNSLNQIKAIKDTSAALQISAQDWQRYSYVASRTGAELGAVEQGFKRLNVATSRAATGARRESQLFEALGISLTKTNGEVKNAAELMPELADRLQQVGDKNQRAAAMQLLFGESASEMQKLLKGGSAEINELSEAAERLGIILSDEQIQKADETAQKLEDVKTVLSAQIAGVVADNADAISSLAGALGDLASGILAFWQSDPEQALAIIGALGGALLGGKVGGGYGALIGGALGGVGGYALGSNMVQGQADANMDPAFRKKQLEAAQREVAMDNRDQGLFASIFGTVRSSSTANTGTPEMARAEVARQQKLYEAALARAAGPNADGPSGPSGPNIDLGFLNRPRGRTGRGGGARASQRAERERIKALRDDVAFANEIAAFKADILRMAESEATNAEARADIGLQLLDLEKERFDRQLKLEGPSGTGKYDAAEVQMLQEQFNTVDAAKRRTIEMEKQERLLREQNDLQADAIQTDMDFAAFDAELATTRKQRLSAEQDLLELQFELERLKLQEVLESAKSTDAEKKIAQRKLDMLPLYKEIQDDLVQLANQSPIEAFFDSIEKSADEIEDTLERVRANKLQDRVDRSVDMADDISASITNAGRMALALENPLEILRTLIFDLTEIFNEEVLLRPLQDWVRQNVGGPIAERVTGAPAGPEGLYIKQLGNESLQAAIQLDQLRLAAARATQGFGVQIPAANDALSGSATDAAGALDPLSAQATQFGMALQQALSMASGGGGGGGLLGTLLSIGASALTGGGPNASLIPDVNATMAANAGIFHEGGRIGPDGRPVRRRLKPGEVNITAQVGERVMRRDIAARFGPALDSIDAGILPGLNLPAMNGFGTRQSADNRQFNFGDINVRGARNEREARRTAKQVSSEVQRGLSRAARQGMIGRD